MRWSATDRYYATASNWQDADEMYEPNNNTIVTSLKVYQLKPQFFSLETAFSIYMPLTRHIFISVRALPDSKTEPKWISSHNKQTCDFNHAQSLISMSILS